MGEIHVVPVVFLGKINQLNGEDLRECGGTGISEQAVPG